jgi:hypothetical protein
MCGTMAGFQHDRAKTALQNMRGRGETNRACSDYCHGFGFVHDILLFY